MQHWTQDTGQDEDKRRKTQQWKPKTWTTLFSEKMVEKKRKKEKDTCLVIFHITRLPL